MSKPIENNGVTWIQRVCDQCGRVRSAGNHARCSRMRQKQYQAKRKTN